jgi:uncharacterized membrane protein
MMGTSVCVIVAAVVLALPCAPAQNKASSVSFQKEIAPLIRSRCLPCHAEDNFNPSELSLDTYEMLMAGGKSGAVVIPGKAEESILVKKMRGTPPFGERMPLNSKREKEAGKARWLTDEEISLIAVWVDQGAKRN